MKFAFSDSVVKAYDKIDDTVIEFKSAILGHCGEIDRFFNLNFGVKLTEKQPLVLTDKILHVFPNFQKITEVQLSQLLFLYYKIRTINSRLFLSQSIIVPSELQEYFNLFTKPEYDIISPDNELTLFGMVYVLSFLSLKYQLSPFLFEVFRNKYFYDIKKQEKSQMPSRIQNYLYELCGKAKPEYNTCEYFSILDIISFNQTTRLYLTKIFFGIEKCILKWTFSSTKCVAFNTLLGKNKPFQKAHKLIPNLLKLRQYWFHGYSLFDEVTYEDETSTFTLEFIVSVLYDLKTLLINEKDYTYIIDLITEFGEKLLNHYLIRYLELSYKLLDKRLFMEEKLNDRIDNLNNANERIQKAYPNYFEMANQLISADNMTFKISAPKFADLTPRTFSTPLLKLIKINSTKNIVVNEIESNKTQLCLAFVDVENENLTTINGKYLYELNWDSMRYLSPRICEYTINLK